MNKAEIEKEIERLLFGSGNNHYINERRELLKARLSQRIDDEKEFKQEQEVPVLIPYRELKEKIEDKISGFRKVRFKYKYKVIEVLQELLSSLDNGGMK